MKPCEAVPVLHVADLRRSLAYYVETLGFTKEFEWGNPVFYAGVRFGQAVLHLNTSEHAADRRGKGAVYLIVDAGVTAYFDKIKTKKINLIGNPPRRYDYGMVDFKLADPDGNWVSFGEEA